MLGILERLKRWKARRRWHAYVDEMTIKMVFQFQKMQLQEFRRQAKTRQDRRRLQKLQERRRKDEKYVVWNLSTSACYSLRNPDVRRSESWHVLERPFWDDPARITEARRRLDMTMNKRRHSSENSSDWQKIGNVKTIMVLNVTSRGTSLCVIVPKDVIDVQGICQVTGSGFGS